MSQIPAVSQKLKKTTHLLLNFDLIWLESLLVFLPKTYQLQYAQAEFHTVSIFSCSSFHWELSFENTIWMEVLLWQNGTKKMLGLPAKWMLCYRQTRWLFMSHFCLLLRGRSFHETTWTVLKISSILKSTTTTKCNLVKFVQILSENGVCKYDFEKGRN